ncbi:uncharacterized protein LOC116413729 [Galleria mellonella]|uniref:Uncharacterized protein LOC116413729 n=1 Tax=Galleria mellonella TaxID=7137 RepID=A0ABM3N0J9_GALME|nr:uncharacterized protein LOC116413729 [Galleria mellonella]
MSLLILLAVASFTIEHAVPYEQYREDGGGSDDDFDDHYEEEAFVSGTAVTVAADFHTRMRRYRDNHPTRTMSSGQIKDVKGALKQILADRKIDSQITTFAETLSDIQNTDIVYENVATKDIPYTGLTKFEESNKKIYDELLDELSNNVERNIVRYKPITREENVSVSKSSGTGALLGAVTSFDTSELFLAKAREGYDNDKTATIKRRRLVSLTNITTTTTTIAGPAFDIPALLEIVSNLTYDYESNLTRLFNETLQKYNIPTCKVPTTTEEITTPTSDQDIENASIVAKCFVCGLEVPAVPQNAYCADAFAGDFLPLVPVDPKARGHIARYRKYCRYLNVDKYVTSPLEPSSVFGRFTGGCSVRWVDLSGIYTQRTCRNRRHAVMGKHFGSKRMAKLEMALKDVDNGCLISPMASLVPFSRGISLYARFHACVCTGNWCNNAMYKRSWAAAIFVMSYSVLAGVLT